MLCEEVGELLLAAAARAAAVTRWSVLGVWLVPVTTTAVEALTPSVPPEDEGLCDPVLIIEVCIVEEAVVTGSFNVSVTVLVKTSSSLVRWSKRGRAKIASLKQKSFRVDKELTL